MTRLVDWASDPASGTLGAYAFVALVLVTSWLFVGAAVVALLILKGLAS